MAYQSIYSGSNATKIPNSGNKDNPFLADFKPGQYARKAQDNPQPKPKQQTQPKATPQPQYKSLFSKITSTAKSVGNTAEQAGKAVAKPVADIATGKGGNAVHDTSQLVGDVTGNAVNQFARGLKYTPQMLAADVSNNAKAQASTQKKAFGTTKSGDIAKKIIGSTVGTASLLVGGGEAKGAKSLLSAGKKELAHKIVNDSLVGGAGNVGMTLINHPEASQKEIGKSLGEGMAFGGAAPIAGKLIGKGIAEGVDKAGISATNNLIKNVKSQSLTPKTTGANVENVGPGVFRVHSPTTTPLKTVGMPVDTATTKSVNTIMSKLRTPAKVIAENKAQGEAQAAQHEAIQKAAEETQKTVENNQKLDDKIELINAKKADDKFTNVDKVKVKQLEGQKQPVSDNVIFVNGKQHELSGQALDQYKEAKAKYDATIQSHASDQSDFGDRRRKAAGMQFAAAKRKITGDLTPVERSSIIKHERSAYVGKDVELNVGGQSVKGKIASQPAFGNVKVKLEDGRTVSIKHSELPEDKRSDQEILAPHTSKQNVKEFSDITTKTLSIPNIPGAKTPFDTPEIIKMRDEQQKIPSTHTDMSPERIALREKVGQMLYQQGGQANAEKAIPIKAEHHADIVLGPPASGKTNIVDPLLQKHGARLIDSDEAKGMLGDVNQAGALHQESDAITTDQLVRAAKRGDNIVLPLVGKSPDRVLAAAQALKDQGYTIDLHYNHLAPEKTAQRAVSRFNETGRFVDPHYVYSEIGLKPKATYDMIKEHEHFSTHKAYDNDVAKGEKPKLTEEGKNSGVRSESTEARRPLRKPDGQETPKSSQAKVASKPAIKSQKISNSTKRKEYNPNKAEPVHVPIEQAKLDTPELKTSKLANRVETMAIKKDLTSGFADKPEYAKVNMQKQAEAATNLLKTDPERLQRIAMGEERPPEGLLPESAYVAAVNQAKKTGDAQTLLDLGTRSHLVSEATGMGQRIRALGELDNDSPTAHIRKIADAGNKRFEKQTGKTFDKVVKQSVKDVKKEIMPVKAKDWNSLIEALKC